MLRHYWFFKLVDKCMFTRILRDALFDYTFIRANLGLTRLDVIKCQIKGEQY